MSNLWILPIEMGDQATSEFAAEAAKTASYLLWALSGRKFTGVTSTTERYTREATDETLVKTELTRQALGDWVLPTTRLRLRGRPVAEILTIRKSDGAIVDPSAYFLVDHSTIQFTDGALWTTYDIEVTYTYGSPPPLAGKMAARLLARELTKSWSGADDCALPARVTSVTRQGVSYTFLDNQDFIAELRTGLYEVDLFLKTANPDKARARSKVFSPDIPRARRVNPKSLELPLSALDITVPAGDVKTISIPFTALAGTTFAETGWTYQAILRSWGGARSLALDSSYVVVNKTSSLVYVSVPYSSALSVLRLVDPGTYDLYALKGTATVYLGSGNLRIKLT